MDSKEHTLKRMDSKAHILEGVDSEAHTFGGNGFKGTHIEGSSVFSFWVRFQAVGCQIPQTQTLNLLPQPSNNVFEANKPQSGYFLLPFLKTTKKIK